MADKSIFELTLQTTFASNDRLVVGNYANSDAEAITGQTLVNLLATSLDGHGGIQSITKTSSTGTDPVIDTYTITMADTTTTTFTVTNGLKGDQGLQTFVYFRWAHVQPSSWSDTTSQPDEWMGVYAGTATTPPTTVSAYTWVKVRGETGETGEAASISSQSVTYMESTSGTIVPSGSWSENVPSVTPGNFLWTRTQLTFNDGSTVTSYSVSRYGIDGTGAVSSVNGQSPDVNGNVALTANNVPTADNLSIQAHIAAAEDDIDTLQSNITDLNAALAIIYPTGDTTDRSAEINAKLSTYGVCQFAPGEYYIGSTITLPNKATLKGCGKESIIKRTSGSTATTMFYITGSNGNVTIKDLYFVGTNTAKPASENTGSGEIAVALDDHANRVSIENCTFYGLTKAGVSYTSGYEWLSSVSIVNCAFLFCNYGVSAGVNGEFANIANCTFNSCFYGAIVIGGNNKFVNCGFDANATGFVLWDNSSSPTNDGHGSAVGCTFDHNTSYALSITNIDNGFLFDSCGFFFGDINIANSRGIMFSNCLVMGNKSASDHTNFIVNNCPGLISITDCCGTNSFTITKTNSDYVFSKNNKTRDGAVISVGDRYNQTGYATGTQAAAGTYSDTTVTFPTAYPSGVIPYVFICPVVVSTTLETGKMQFFVSTVSNTGFTVRLFNNANIARSFNFNWHSYILE